MTQTVTVHEAKTNLSRLIASALAGEDIVIARGSEPAVRLVPVTATHKRLPGLLKHLGPVPFEAFAPLADDELKDIFGTAEF